jgi:signal transduction histidine kinase
VAVLTVIRGPDSGRRIEFNQPRVLIGRDSRNNIRLHDSEASRQHAEFRQTPEGYLLCDLGSSNGSHVNGKRIEQALVRTGDLIRLGQTEMIFTAGPVSLPDAVQLADRIAMITRRHEDDASAIVRSIKHTEGGEYLRHPERAGSQWLQEALNNLSVVYEASQAVSRISDVNQLLEHILDLAFTSLKPHRGCIMLKSTETGELTPTAVRYAEHVNREERIALSRTITDWVLERGEGVLVLDAAQDQRFQSAQSIVTLGIREAICVPLRGRLEVLGVMYVDTTTDRAHVLQTQKPARFTEDHLKLMIAIAHQAGLALEDSRYYQAMVQAERLAAIGQTITTLSHHIKNLLQGLRSGSYLVENGLTNGNMDMLRHGWSVVQKNQDKIYNLVMDMLSYSKEREPVLEPTNINRIVTDVTELMTPRARELGVVLETHCDPLIAAVAVDAEGIHRALLNIVTNAMDAVEGRPSGRVAVETVLEANGRYVHIMVTDNGPGVAEDQIERIFQIFVSSKGAKGSGLGLPVSRKIAREHGGDIRVKSVAGEGACFIIELPVRTAATAAAEAGEAQFPSTVAFGEMTQCSEQ